jgi:hypothetical protein
MAKAKTTTPTTTRVEMLAAEFTELLAQEIGRENMAVVVTLNDDMDTLEEQQGEDETMPCASFSFCDADMVMMQAFEAFGLTPPGEIEDEAARHKALELWVNAWTLAQRKHFQAYREPLPMRPADNDA